MEVHGMVLSITANVQQVPPDLLVLSHQQTRKCLCHITIDCWRETQVLNTVNQTLMDNELNLLDVFYIHVIRVREKLQNLQSK